MAARLQWDVNILQGCGKVVTSLWNRQCGCKVAVGLRIYYKVVARL